MSNNKIKAEKNGFVLEQGIYENENELNQEELNKALDDMLSDNEPSLIGKIMYKLYNLL